MLRPVLAAILLFLTARAGAGGDFAYVSDATQVLAKGAVVIDTRPLAECRGRSLAGARCLPASDFLGPQRRLASWRDILWLLGTAGLRGDETVLVAGGQAIERDFVAGVLYLAGQRELRVLTEPVVRVLAAGASAGEGRPRSFARERVFEAPMRDALLVLAGELAAMRPLPAALDGRSAAEYWGETVRAARGGHLPGAVSLPDASLRAAADRAAVVLPEGEALAYGHDPYEGIAYFTLLRAGSGVAARVYAEGWAEWAADGALPADAASYPERVLREPAATPLRPEDAAPRGALIATLALLAAALGAGVWIGRRRHR
ncbi:MAG: hypothetical protein OHK0026_03470 [Rhodocyclaceae bacterium]